MDSVVCNPSPPNAIVVYGSCDHEVSVDGDSNSLQFAKANSSIASSRIHAGHCVVADNQDPTIADNSTRGIDILIGQQKIDSGLVN